MADNFWAMGDTGPCGRCSEIYYDRGPERARHRRLHRRRRVAAASASSRSGTTCSWSSSATTTARSTPLPAPSIDTGMGLERISAVMQGTLSNYDTPLFMPMLARDRRAWPATAYGGTMEPTDVSMRVVADHLRAMTFLIADGVVPSNEWRGYVLRKIMRRAMRHGRKLGFTSRSCTRSSTSSSREMGDAYPELKAGRDAIVQVVRQRRGAVRRGADRRTAPARGRARARRAPATRSLPGDEAFKLYDTFGLPRDFIEDLAVQPGPASSTPRASSARWKASARRRARRQRVRRARRAKSSASGPTRARRAATRPATSSRATTRRGRRRAGARGVRRRAAAKCRAAGGHRRLGGARAHAVLRRGGRPGLGQGG